MFLDAYPPIIKWVPGVQLRAKCKVQQRSLDLNLKSHKKSLLQSLLIIKHLKFPKSGASAALHYL